MHFGAKEGAGDRRGARLTRRVAWAVIGCAVVLQLTALALIVLPLALAAIGVLIGVHGPPWSESGGAAVGAGLTSLVVGSLTLSGGTGFEPLPWFVAGAGLVAVGGALLYVWR